MDKEENQITHTRFWQRSKPFYFNVIWNSPATAFLNRAHKSFRVGERFVRSIKEECLEQMILFGEDALRNSIREFLDHFHQERNHQGLGSQSNGIQASSGWQFARFHG